MYDVGFCDAHNRVFEGLCKTCERYVLAYKIIILLSVVCASCVLFASHQKHDILSLKDGVMFLRNTIDGQIKLGKLKKEFTESHLLEIREYTLRVEKYKNDTVKKIDEVFKEIITTLKTRKNDLINDVLERFNNETEMIKNNEHNWIEKQKISDRLINLSKDVDDNILLANPKLVMEGIRKLNEKLSFKEIKVFNDLDCTLTIERKENNNKPIVLSQEEIVHYLSKYLTISEPNNLEFKA